MAARGLLLCGILLATSLAGCLGDEPAPGPGTATAMALRPTFEELGQPAEWGAAIGQGPREPKGAAHLVMAFAVESPNPEGSRLVDGLYNMREHVRMDDAVGDGAAPHWLYQHRDESTITMQRVASADGRSEGSAYGALWDWSYWGLAAADGAITEWEIDSDAVARIAAETLANWTDPDLDHLYLLYEPAMLPLPREPHWLLGVWNHDGTLREHVVIRATDGEVVPLDAVHPDVPERGAVEGTLVLGSDTEATHPIDPAGNRSRLLLRLSTEPPAPAGAVTLEGKGAGWEELERTTEDGTQVVMYGSLGGGPLDVTVRLDGAASQYTLGWCADGTFNDILGRTPTACDA